MVIIVHSDLKTYAFRKYLFQSERYKAVFKKRICKAVCAFLKSILPFSIFSLLEELIVISL